MNNNVLHNRLNDKNEQHPFHILPPSYIPFVVALVAGMFVATFAFLMPEDLINEVREFGNVLRSFLVNKNILSNDRSGDSFRNIVLIFGQTWCNDADTALLLLTAANFSPLLAKAFMSQFLFYLAQNFFIITIFFSVYLWIWIMMLPVVIVDKKYFSVWLLCIIIIIFSSHWVLQNINPDFQWYSLRTFRVDWLFLKDLVIQTWPDYNYDIVSYKLWQIKVRLEFAIGNFSLWTFVFYYVPILKWIEPYDFLKRRYLMFQQSVTNRQKTILYVTFFSVFILPACLDVLINIVSGMGVAIGLLIALLNWEVAAHIFSLFYPKIMVNNYQRFWVGANRFLNDPRTWIIGGGIVSPHYYFYLEDRRSARQNTPLPTNTNLAAQSLEGANSLPASSNQTSQTRNIPVTGFFGSNSLLSPYHLRVLPYGYNRWGIPSTNDEDESED